MNEPSTQQQPESPLNEHEQIDPMDQMALEKFRSEQNLVGGLVAGFIAAVGVAVLWAVITIYTGYQIGWMAIGVGIVVGFVVRFVGKGLDQSFAIGGAALALFGCLLGNLFTACHLLADAEGVGFFDVLTSLNPNSAFELMKLTFSPMDLLFYGFAVYEGFKLSCRQISQEELDKAVKGSAAAQE